MKKWSPSVGRIVTVGIALAATCEERGSWGSSIDGADIDLVQSACPSPEAFERAKVAYLRAVAGASALVASRKSGDRNCRVDSVVEAAFDAYEACPAAARVFRTATSARALRSELKGTVALSILTGVVTPANWHGLNAALAAGLSFYGPENTQRLTLRPGGRGEIFRIVEADSENDSGVRSWVKYAFTYKFEHRSDGNLGISIRGGTFDGGSIVLVLTPRGFLDDEPVSQPGGEFLFTPYALSCSLAALPSTPLPPP